MASNAELERRIAKLEETVRRLERGPSLIAVTPIQGGWQWPEGGVHAPVQLPTLPTPAVIPSKFDSTPEWTT